MKKTIFLFGLLQFLFQIGFGQFEFDKDPFSFADTILKNGDYNVDLMAIDYPLETKLLMTKMTEAVSKDTAWFLKYMNENLKDSGKLKYDKRFGLSEVEYDKMQNGISEGKKYVKVGEETLNISNINADTLIRFKGSGYITTICSLTIDKKNKIIKYGNTVIPYKNEIHADDWTVIKAWNGHQFRFEEMNTTDLTKIMELKSKSYRLLIGKTQKSRRNYLNLEAKEIDNGRKPLDVEFAFFF
ncbi:hypothetical protein [Ferruginibacter sp.]